MTCFYAALIKGLNMNLVMLSVAMKWGRWPWNPSKSSSVATVYFLFNLRAFTAAKQNPSCLWALEELEKQWWGFIWSPLTLLLIWWLLLWPQQKLATAGSMPIHSLASLVSPNCHFCHDTYLLFACYYTGIRLFGAGITQKTGIWWMVVDWKTR